MGDLSYLVEGVVVILPLLSLLYFLSLHLCVSTTTHKPKVSSLQGSATITVELVYFRLQLAHFSLATLESLGKTDHGDI